MRSWRLKKRTQHFVESGWNGFPDLVRKTTTVAEGGSRIVSDLVDVVRGMRPDVTLPPHTRVVCIGGVSWGGDGKTPVARHIARRLRDRNKHVAFIARSVGGRKRPGLVPSGQLLERRSHVRRFGDEAVMVSGTLGGIDIWAGHRRASVIKAARTEPDFIIVDDGLSLLGVPKHLEIALLSSERTILRRIPAGPLRRPISDTSRADVIGIRAPDTDALPDGIDERIDTLLAEAEAREHPWFLFRLKAVQTGDGLSVVLASGIANADRFEMTASEAGYEVRGSVSYPDHHMPSRRDLAELSAMARRRRSEAILVTGKDAPRFPAIVDGVPVRVMTTRVAIMRNPEVLDEALATVGVAP